MAFAGCLEAPVCVQRAAVYLTHLWTAVARGRRLVEWLPLHRVTRLHVPRPDRRRRIRGRWKLSGRETTRWVRCGRVRGSWALDGLAIGCGAGAGGPMQRLAAGDERESRDVARPTARSAREARGQRGEMEMERACPRGRKEVPIFDLYSILRLEKH